MIVSEFSFSASLALFVPEILLALGALGLALFAAFTKSDKDKPALVGLDAALALCMLALAIIWFGGTPTESSGFGGLFAADKGATYLKILTLIGASLSIPLIRGYYKRLPEQYVPEIPALLVLSVLGILLVSGARHFMALYVSVELVSLASYVLATVHRDDKNASEAGVKYFVLGSLASCVMLFGMSLIYGATNGVLSYEGGAFVLPDAQGLFLAGTALLCAGLFFKVSAAPFHSWTPDVYEGAPAPSAAFFGIVGKLTGVAALINLCAFFFYPQGNMPAMLFAVIGIISIFAGAVGAIKQTHLRRMIAFSSVGHMGYILLGLSAIGTTALQASLLYITVYVTLSVGFFACLLMLRGGETLASIKGLSRTRPWVAFGLAVIMLSLAGIPPFAGFFAKLMLFKALIVKGHGIMAAFAILGSAISAFYYLRVIKFMYVDAPEQEDASERCTPSSVVLGAMVLFNIFFMFVMDVFLRAAIYAALAMQ